jgi:hypothetical protein
MGCELLIVAGQNGPRNAARMLEQRLQIFVDAGLLPRVPTRWQLLQGEIEMTPYVVSTDATAEEGYRDHLASHPLVRQLRLFAHVGVDHLRTGSALGARLDSVCAHLILTFHRGMPVFDLQVVQTHERGLDRLRAAIEDTLAGATPVGQRRHAIGATLLRDHAGYLHGFLGDDGYIARAARFDYPSAGDQGSTFPREFWSLVDLAAYCERVFPAHPRDLAWTAYPRHLARLASRRVRDGKGMGWFS